MGKEFDRVLGENWPFFCRILTNASSRRITGYAYNYDIVCFVDAYGVCYYQVVTHSAIFDFWPATRHALRATPHGEKPISVEDWEKQTGKVAKDRQQEIWRQQGVEVITGANSTKARGYND